MERCKSEKGVNLTMLPEGEIKAAAQFLWNLRENERNKINIGFVAFAGVMVLYQVLWIGERTAESSVFVPAGGRLAHEKSPPGLV